MVMVIKRGGVSGKMRNVLRHACASLQMHRSICRIRALHRQLNYRFSTTFSFSYPHDYILIDGVTFKSPKLKELSKYAI